MRHAWALSLLASTTFLSFLFAGTVWFFRDWFQGLPWQMTILWFGGVALLAMALFLPKGWVTPLVVPPLTILFYWLWRVTKEPCLTFGPDDCVDFTGLGVVALGGVSFLAGAIGALLAPVLTYFNPRRPGPATDK